MNGPELYRDPQTVLPADFLPLLFGTWAGARIPALPPEEVQCHTVGAAGTAALTEGYQFFHLIRSVCDAWGRHQGKHTVVLDYGCGWGRITRFFLTTYDNGSVHGVDVDPSMIDYCRSLIGVGQYAVTTGRPPLEFPDGSVDLLYAYSVFSHLSPRLQDALVADFHRIVRPGGFVFLTTRLRRFIDQCAAMNGAPGLDAYCTALAAAFREADVAKAQFDAGEFVFRPYPPGIDGLGPDYGEAVVPRAYAERRWRSLFRLIDFIDDADRLPQACFVLERR